MRVIATKNNSIMSRLIRWVTSQPASHFAIVFDEKFVFHSNLLGAHPEFFTSFKKRNEIVESEVFFLTLEQEESVYQSIIKTFDGKGYDFGAFLFAGIYRLANKLFNVEIPYRNKWNGKNKFLCTEIVEALLSTDLKMVFRDGQDLSMITAYDIIIAIRTARMLRI